MHRAICAPYTEKSSLNFHTVQVGYIGNCKGEAKFGLGLYASEWSYFVGKVI